MSGEYIHFREPMDFEKWLLARAFASASNVDPNRFGQILVCPMDDGGMGSLRLWSAGVNMNDRQFGSVVSQYSFADSDGVEVLVELIFDSEGLPYELDVWKTDFSPLVSPNSRS